MDCKLKTGSKSQKLHFPVVYKKTVKVSFRCGDTVHELLTRLEVWNVMSLDYQGRILGDVTGCLLGTVLQCPGSPAADIYILLLYQGLLDGIYDTFYSCQHSELVNASLL